MPGNAVRNAVQAASVIALAVTLLAFGVHFALVGFGVYSDGLGYYAPLRSVVFDRDLRVDNEYEHFASSASRFGGGVRFSGRAPEYSVYPIGMGLVLSPFFGLGHLFALALRGLGQDMALNGYAWPYEFFYCVGSILLGVAGLVLCFTAMEKRYGTWPAFLATAAIWFASPLTYYLAIEASMSHAVSQFMISAFLCLCLLAPWRHRLRHQVLIGVVLGLAALVRPQDALFGIVPLVLAVFPQRESAPLMRRLVPVAVIAVVSLLMLVPQLVVYRIQYGQLRLPYLDTGVAAGQTAIDWRHPKVGAVLFSGFHGLFSWHPILLIAVLGVVLSARESPRVALAFLLAFGLQVLLVAAWHVWWQGASFGGRMFSSSSFVFALGLAALWSRFKGRAWRVFGLAVTAFFMAWNVLLLMQFKSGMIPAEQPVPLREMAANQVKVVPYFIQHVTRR